MPILFVGHGNPMLAIQESSFSKSLNEITQKFPKPKSILVISAHWESDQTEVLLDNNPKTIHDFYGFPNELYEQRYPCLGAEKLAQNLINQKLAQASTEWGLDHGAWSVLKHLYPSADVAVTQLSLNRKLAFQQHYEMGKKLNELREHDVLIIGSGNLVHNLRKLSWNSPNQGNDTSISFDQMVWKKIINQSHDDLINIKETHLDNFKLCHPSDEHYLPLLYCLGAAQKDDQVESFFVGYDLGMLSMRSMIWF